MADMTEVVAAAAAAVAPEAAKDMTVLFFNIANATADDSDVSRAGGYNFPARLPLVIQILKQRRPTVACLLEVRNCIGMTVEEILFRICTETSLRVAQDIGMNPTPRTMHRVTLYDPDVVFPIRTASPWCGSLSNVPSGAEDPKRPYSIGVRAGIVEFAVRASSDPLNPGLAAGLNFTTVCMHFPLGAENRLETARWLVKDLDRFTYYQRQRVVIGGDFNTFMDDRGQEQIDILLEQYTHCSSHIKETFLTFPHDPFAVKNGGVLQRSCLDHVFQHRDAKLVTGVEVISTDTAPLRASDHYALLAHIA
jgi:hypothetical protein